ncbi:MAG: CBS domain-containing protein [Bdellovibrionota bacterium]
MFYISDITGVQSIYTEELFRIIRAHEQEALVSKDAAEVNEAQVSIHDGDAVEIHELHHSSDNPSTSFSSSAASMAGSSMRSTENKNAQVNSMNRFISAEKQQRLKEDENIAPVVKLRKVEIQEDEQNEISKNPEAKSKPNPYTKLDHKQQKRELALTASQIMSSPVVTLRAKDTITAAAEIFKEKRFRHIPVVSKKGALIGILSDRNLHQLSDNSQCVKDVMSRPVLCARAQTEIRLIAQVLFKERIGAMPIVDENQELVGIITRSDILRAVVNQAPLELWT